MNVSDSFAGLALIISLASLWLSYRGSRLSNKVNAAEKRTQVHCTLVGVLLEAQGLFSLVRKATTYKGTDVTFPKGLDEIESQLSTMTMKKKDHLNLLREENSNDPVQIEKYKAFAREVEARVKQVAPMIRELPVIENG